MAPEKLNEKRHVVILFDENMPHMEECAPDDSCVANQDRLCRHRLNFNDHIRYLTRSERKELNKIGLDDLGIILFFIDLINKNSICWPETDLGVQTFVIVTKDDNFLDSAKERWEGLDSSHPRKLDLKFYDDYVLYVRRKIFIEQIKCRNQSTNNREGNRRCLIKQLNDKWAGTLP